jgi:hydroxylamine dehydrogenase
MPKSSRTDFMEDLPMTKSKTEGFGNAQIPRLLVLSLVVVIIVLGLILIIQTIGSSSTPAPVERANALDGSRDECVICHSRTTPGIIEQYGHSSMAAAEVSCRNCHQVSVDYPGAIEHEGVYVLNLPTPAMCAKCHSQEVAQFNQSRHALPAYVAYAGTADLNSQLRAVYEAIPEGGFAPDKMRNSLYALEGPAITRFACEACHNVGKPNTDGTVGDCTACHLRHEFSLSQARKPETCNACHIGPDHPQWEIYQESPHGIAYATGGEHWNWEAEAGTLTVEDFPAPTCATCHFSGFGASGTTHDIGDRLSWYLFAPISTRRPSWQDNQIRMKNVCLECHNTNFIDDFFNDADAATKAVNDWVIESDELVQPLKDNGSLTAAPFDEPIDFTYFELWHHWGRTTKFGAWMQGPDYTQWHGAYEVLADLAELSEMVDEKLAEGIK